MKVDELVKGQRYLSKVIGLEGVREIRIHSILTKVVTCEDIQTKKNQVARICDIASSI